MVVNKRKKLKVKDFRLPKELLKDLAKIAGYGILEKTLFKKGTIKPV